MDDPVSTPQPQRGSPYRHVDRRAESPGLMFVPCQRQNIVMDAGSAGCLEHQLQLLAPPGRARPEKAVRDDAFVHLPPLRDDALRHARFKQRGLLFGISQAWAKAVDAGRQFGTGPAEYPPRAHRVAGTAYS